MRRLPLFLCLFLLCLSAWATPTDEPRALLRVGVGGDHVQVVLRCEAFPEFREYKNGQTLTYALTNVAPQADTQNVGSPIVEKVVTDPQKKTVTLSLGSAYKRHRAYRLRHPYRLVITVEGDGDSNGEVLRKPPPGTFHTAPTTGTTPGIPTGKVQRLPQAKSGFDTIVLDPGHGGRDSGAISQGAKEKDLTLDLTRQLKKVLEAKGLRVILTRTGDSSLPLRDRTAVANYNRADLLVSLHLNASTMRGAHGAEVYYLSREPLDAWSKVLANRENAGLGSSETVSGGTLGLVLWDLAQTASIERSATLANAIQKALNEKMGTRERGVKQAPLVVLEGATMPAVLVELAFMTEPKDLAVIKNSKARTAWVEAVATAIIQAGKAW